MNVWKYTKTMKIDYFTVDDKLSFPFLLQTFRFWVETSHFRPPMVFISHNSFDAPVLAPLMNVLFLGRFDFLVSLLARDMSRNVWNRLKGSSMVGTWILPNNIRFPSPKCYTTFWRMTIYSDTHWWDITIIVLCFTDLNALKRYDSNEVDRRTWIHVASGTL